MLNENQIIEQLEYVIKQSATPTKKGIGILTSENRDTWAKAYQLLIKGKVYQTNNIHNSLKMNINFGAYVILE